MDTIFAIATAPGRAGVAIIRVSGPGIHAVAEHFRFRMPPPRSAALRVLRLADDSPLDEALILQFSRPRSFTGEDLLEIHCHGSLAVQRRILSELSGIDGLRLAEPGEFSRRALENDRLDLTDVEGLGDLIEAETEAQRVQAQRVLSGALRERIEVWRAWLIRAAALIEATLDFADEEVPVDVSPEVLDLLEKLEDELNEAAAGVAQADALRRGFQVAIVGPPNAGKSTLLNALARRDVALTSEIAGTTRDVLEVRADVQGFPVTFLDTAGLREADDVVERMGVAKGRTLAAEADIRVFLSEDGAVDDSLWQDDDILALAKADQRRNVEHAVSGKTGQGLNWLEEQLAVRLENRVSAIGVASHERHRKAIEVALLRLGEAKSAFEMGSLTDDLIAEEIRGAQRSLEVLVGRIDVENLLDEIFASFCLGK